MGEEALRSRVKRLRRALCTCQRRPPRPATSIGRPLSSTASSQASANKALRARSLRKVCTQNPAAFAAARTVAPSSSERTTTA
jgi:hypothetical protein